MGDVRFGEPELGDPSSIALRLQLILATIYINVANEINWITLFATFYCSLCYRN